MLFWPLLSRMCRLGGLAMLICPRMSQGLQRGGLPMLNVRICDCMFLNM